MNNSPITKKPSGLRRAVAPAMAAVAAALLFTPFGERLLSALLTVGDVEAIDFATLKLGEKPNQFLLCPPGYCAAEAHGASPLFPMSMGGLRTQWDAVIVRQPRVTIIAADKDQIDYIQRTALIRFPDIITVRFIALSPGQSTLAVYSRSVYGTSDFGVNRKRIETWLAALNVRLSGGPN